MSGKGSEFENKIMEEIEHVAQIRHVFTKGYNPRENGITERMNGTIIAMLRRITSVPTEWDLRLPFCMMAYNITPHSSTGESPYFILHGIDPNCSSSTIPRQEVSLFEMEKTMSKYKTAIVQGVQEIHERVKEQNDRVRRSIKSVYDNENNVDLAKHPKVGERVYVKCPAEKTKTSHPKFACEWAGPYRVIAVSENSATVTRICENSDPNQIPMDQLRVVPSCFSDERIDTTTSRGKRGRKKVINAQVQQMTVAFCRRAMLTMEKQPGHLLNQCLDECLMKAKLSEIPHTTFPGAFANESVGTFWKAWIASSIFGRQDIDIAQKIKLYRQGAVCLNGKALKNILKFAYDRCTTWTEFLCETHSIRKHQPMEKHHVEDLYDAALKELKEELNEESKESKPIKDGPVLFAAPGCAALLENDGIRGGIRTEFVNGVSSMLKKFDGWSSCGTWVLIGL